MRGYTLNTVSLTTAVTGLIRDHATFLAHHWRDQAAASADHAIAPTAE